MSDLTISELKLLFSYYSPLATNSQLYSKYIDITNKSNIVLKNIRTVFNQEIYRGLTNESVVKAAFLEHLSFKQSPNNSVTVLELSTGKSRADICVFDVSSKVFEIKTEFDTFYRLDSQMSDYGMAFDYLYLIIPESKLNDALKLTIKTIGIITYKRNIQHKITFSLYRSPTLNYNLNPEFQLNQLTKLQLYKISKMKKCSKQEMINFLLLNKSNKQINRLYIDSMRSKYMNNWMFLCNHKNDIEPLDYQWFFSNNLSTKTV